MNPKNIKDGIYAFPEEQLTEKEYSFLLFTLTDQYYTFANCASAYWGKEGESKPERWGSEAYYQLMPKTTDDGFFDWYIEVRQYYQFFETRHDCVLQFIFYWNTWVKSGKPKSQFIINYEAGSDADSALN